METRERLEIKEEFEHSDIFFVENRPVLIIKASDTYIPTEEFKSLFTKATELIKEHGIQKVIFDKRRLQTFHQPSMEWYYVHWKEDLLQEGVNTHRKLLPDDQIFKKSVELGIAKIKEKYPHIRLSEMDIQYFDTLQEAIEN